MDDRWSLDARVLVRPAATFHALAGASPDGRTRSGFWIGARRPLFLTFVLASGISLAATSVATVRLIPATAVYWAFVPLVEILALIVVVWRRRRSHRLPALIDTFFAGHAAWTLFVLFAGASISVMSPANLWFFLTRVGLSGLLAVLAWSAYVDFCFFRHVCGASVARAVLDVALNRFITWTLIFWIVAVPEPTPAGVFQELVEAIVELTT